MDSDVAALLAAIDAGAIGTFRRQRRNACLCAAASLIPGSTAERVAALRRHISALYRARSPHAPADGSVRSWIVEADRWASVDLGDRQLRSVLALEIYPDPISKQSCLNHRIDQTTEVFAQ